MRRGSKRTLAVALVIVALVLPPARTTGSAARTTVSATPPNIVLILTDDQRWDTLWAMPNVASLLQAHGMTFDNSFVPNPLCCPSRASILTGTFSHTNGVYRNDPPNGGFSSFVDSSTIATWLHGSGYNTALIGKYLNGYETDQASYVPPGWDRWFAGTTLGYFNWRASDQGVLTTWFHSAPEDYSTDVMATKADEFIRGADSSQPLFLYFAPYGPHRPTTPAPRHVGMFSGLPPARPPSFNEPDVSDKPDYISKIAPFDDTTIADIDQRRIDQYETIQSLDDAVGTIVQALSDTGRLDNTMIVFASDNGFLNGEHRWQKKAVPYEEAIRVPLVIRYDPLGLSGQTDTHQVLNVDWTATWVDLAGLSEPTVEGSSLMPLLQQQAVKWRGRFGLEHLNETGVPTYCGVRSKRKAYVQYDNGQEELYDLVKDPYEVVNVAADPKYAVALARHRAWAHKLCNPPPPGFVWTH